MGYVFYLHQQVRKNHMFNPKNNENNEKKYVETQRRYPAFLNDWLYSL
jgi:hypothetical protein